MNQQRLISFDILKLFTIFLVLWGHCIQHLLSSNHLDEPVYRIIYSFHMPLFLMISGYFSNSSMKLNFKTFLYKKTTNLILPCITWALFSYVIFNLILYNEDINILSFNQIYIYIKDEFWFLKCCFICYLITFLCYKTKLKKKYWIPIALLISINMSYQVNLLYPAFIIGFILKENPIILKFINKNSRTLIIIFIVMLFFLNKEYWNVHSLKNEFFNHNYISILKEIYTRLFKIVIGLIGSLSFISMFNILFVNNNPKEKILRMFTDWGKYTLEIYILQTYILEYGLGAYLKFDSINFFTFNFIISPLLSLTVLFVCIKIAKLLHKSNFTAFIFFGKINNKCNIHTNENKAINY